MVEDEVVEHDDAWPLAQRLDDPAVRVRVVADVVEADVRVGGRRSSLYSEIPVRSGGRGEKYATFMRASGRWRGPT
jgi:hypothetical protein